MNLESLDRRSFMRSVEQELERIRSRPIELSAIRNGKSAVESKLKYFAGLREVATPEEACELDAQMEEMRAQLTKIDAELVARADEEKVEPGPDLHRETLGMESGSKTPQNKATDYAVLLSQVLEKLSQPGEAKESVLKAWLKEYPWLSRTQVTDYRAGRIKGHVSPSKCKKIEAAILTSAVKLGLATRTDSDCSE